MGRIARTGMRHPATDVVVRPAYPIAVRSIRKIKVVRLVYRRIRDVLGIGREPHPLRKIPIPIICQYCVPSIASVPASNLEHPVILRCTIEIENMVESWNPSYFVANQVRPIRRPSICDRSAGNRTDHVGKRVGVRPPCHHRTGRTAGRLA